MSAFGRGDVLDDLQFCILDIYGKVREEEDGFFRLTILKAR
jgi:hypothetical protein